MSSSRAGLRFLNTFRQTAFRQQRRGAQTVAESAGVPVAPIAQAAPQSAFQKLWNSKVGPKTVHFWAPIMKWGLVLAGAADFARPASSLSLSQNLALTATGAIWTRWCFVIRPKNVFLASVNFLVFCVGAAQSTRAILYQQQLKRDSIGQELEGEAKKDGNALKNIVENPKAAIEKITS